MSRATKKKVHQVELHGKSMNKRPLLTGLLRAIFHLRTPRGRIYRVGCCCLYVSRAFGPSKGLLRLDTYRDWLYYCYLQCNQRITKQWRRHLRENSAENYASERREVSCPVPRDGAARKGNLEWRTSRSGTCFPAKTRTR